MNTIFLPHGERDGAARVERGSAIEDRPEDARRADSLPQSPGLRSDLHGFRLVCDTDMQAVRRGGDFYDESGWARRNVNTSSEPPYEEKSGKPGIRLAHSVMKS